MRTDGCRRTVDREISRFPCKERLHMPGSLTTPGRPGARDDAPGCVAFRHLHGVGTQNRNLSRLNGWPMRPPCQRFAETLAGNCACLGADVDRYSFIVRDLHSLLLAGLPALRRCLPLFPPERTLVWPALRHYTDRWNFVEGRSCFADPSLWNIDAKQVRTGRQARWSAILSVLMIETCARSRWVTKVLHWTFQVYIY